MNDLDALQSWEHWSNFLFKLGAISSPAELQGYACGLRSGTKPIEAESWLSLAEEFMDLPEPLVETEQKSALSAYYQIVEKNLADADYSFRMLLPDDAVSLRQRLEALAEWSQAFLSGFGISSSNQSIEDEDAREMLQNLAEVAQVDVGAEEGEDNEAIYTELCEFVRVAAMYLFQLYHLDQLKSLDRPAPSGEESQVVANDTLH